MPVLAERQDMEEADRRHEIDNMHKEDSTVCRQGTDMDGVTKLDTL